MNVNYIHQLSCFFFKTDRNDGMRPSHISLYMALFKQWNSLRFCATMTVDRKQLMHAAKIGSRDCYHRCLRDLHEWGYLEYHPAEPRCRAKVTMKPLTLLAGWPVSGKDDVVSGAENDTENDPETMQKPGHFNKTPERINNKQKSTPSLDEIFAYFSSQGCDDPDDGLKFFSYYEANGWRQGGKADIVNWKAAATKWMLNKRPSGKKGPGLQFLTDKPQDYGTPL